MILCRRLERRTAAALTEAERRVQMARESLELLSLGDRSRCGVRTLDEQARAALDKAGDLESQLLDLWRVSGQFAGQHRRPYADA